MFGDRTSQRPVAAVPPSHGFGGCCVRPRAGFLVVLGTKLSWGPGACKGLGDCGQRDPADTQIPAVCVSDDAKSPVRAAGTDPCPVWGLTAGGAACAGPLRPPCPTVRAAPTAQPWEGSVRLRRVGPHVRGVRCAPEGLREPPAHTQGLARSHLESAEAFWSFPRAPMSPRSDPVGRPGCHLHFRQEPDTPGDSVSVQTPPPLTQPL